ncbi:hypothetical protein HID58_066926, partial [Brassica napus]
ETKPKSLDPEPVRSQFRDREIASSFRSTYCGEKSRLENVSLCLSSSSNRCPGVRHSTFESLCLGRSSQSIASGFLRLWDSLNFKKDREFVGITVLFLDEKVNVVGKIRYAQGSDLTKETTRVVICLLIDP